MKLSNRLNGRNIVLRKLALTDADSITEHIKDKAIIKWLLAVPYPYRKKNAVSFIRSRQNERRTRKSYTFGISLKVNNEIIGIIDLSDIDWEDKKAEMGYWIGKRFWGQGLMTEAINSMARFGFRELKLNKIYARVFEGNLASMKALEKNKFRHEGILRDEIFKYGRWIDEYYYGLLKSEYKRL
ncbi:MAG: GNAT family N-acetyltransferase [Candidatus Zixiibacteriota bacterium]|nr:MAG: GNAT family N-acetyltransferase [candidate division Zixibacteria bacterium]